MCAFPSSAAIFASSTAPLALMAANSPLTEADPQTPLVDGNAKDPIYNVEALVSSIVGGLSAQDIIDQNPEILSQFCHSTQSQIRDAFQKHMNNGNFSDLNRNKVLNAVTTIWVGSLRNSKYNSSTQTLETNILLYLSWSTQENLRQLIEKGEKCFHFTPAKTDEGLKAHIYEITQMLGEVEAGANLFYYSDPEVKEAIETLAKTVVNHDISPLFPKCKKYFSTFTQNLLIARDERPRLKDLRRRLHEKAQALRQELATMQEKLATKAPDSPRTILFRHYEHDFWKAGSLLLKEAFRATFQIKLHKHCCHIPADVNTAILDASTVRPEWSQFRNRPFLTLSQIEQIPVGFTEVVWSNYIKEVKGIGDLGDFMRHALANLPEENYRTLESNLGKSSSKALLIYNIIHLYFTGQVRKCNFMTLRDWLYKHPPAA